MRKLSDEARDFKPSAALDAARSLQNGIAERLVGSCRRDLLDHYSTTCGPRLASSTSRSKSFGEASSRAKPRRVMIEPFFYEQLSEYEKGNQPLSEYYPSETHQREV